MWLHRYGVRTVRGPGSRTESQQSRDAVADVGVSVGLVAAAVAAVLAVYAVYVRAHSCRSGASSARLGVNFGLGGRWSRLRTASVA